MSTKSTTNEQIRQLLVKGHTYEEIKSSLGVSTANITHAKRPLDEAGISYQKKSPERIRKSKIRSMGNGSIMQILDAMTDEELDELYALSFKSWADAIIVALRTKR